MLSDVQKILDYNRQVLDTGEMTVENPIVIKDIDEYVSAEYELIHWLSAMAMCEDTVKHQRLIADNGKYIDEITVSLRPVFKDVSEAKDAVFYFDITDGFKKLAESLK